MGVLNSQEIEKRLNKMQLIRNPRRGQNGRPLGMQDDSYDLSAGTAVWKTPTKDRYGGSVETRSYLLETPGHLQPTVTVLPGQMIFVVTHEDIAMPRCLCGTVNKMQLIRNPRRGQNGRPLGMQDDSYDLSAGTAVWKTPTKDRYGGSVETRSYLLETPGHLQPL